MKPVENLKKSAAQGREFLKKVDKFIAEHGDFVGEFVKYRGDFISSDREVVAFMLALNEMMN